jgi:hypothetical protein
MSFDHKEIPSLTGERTGLGAFGAYTVDAAIGDGRFGSVFRGHDAAGVAVVIRSFAVAFSPEQLERFMAALAALCEAPLEHPSIARPLAYALAHEGQPYVVHAYLPGVPLSEFTAASGRRGLADIVNRLTYVAGALDFAAATNVLHGALSDSDIIFSSESAGVSGLGLVQALESAGVAGFAARREDDVAALMAIARNLLGGQASPAAESLLSGPVPANALTFAAALHRTLDLDPEMDAPPVSAVESTADLPFSDVDDFPSEGDGSPDPVGADLVDIQLRHDEERLSAPLMFGATEPVAVSRSGGGGPWLIIGAVALALGILAGFAGGFLVARDTPAPAPAPAAVADTGTSKPEPPKSQTFTDAAVDEAAKPSEAVSGSAPVNPAPKPPPAEASPRAETPAPPVRPARQPAVPPPSPERSGPAAMRVESLPAGAQVFVDGRSVGYTPLVVGQLSPGTHSIRMQLPGYRPWVTAVTLSPGARERVAASLEQ